MNKPKYIVSETGGRAEKRQRILDAAEEIMSQKGPAETSISEIAVKAGVMDSGIYQFFKGKQDLLFSIPEERLRDVLVQLKDHLTGISDPVSRLRKMIWFHLHFNDAHAGYARLLLLECRSSQDFYDSEAYKLIREYAGILMDILDQGRREKVFRDDVKLTLMRDAVLGALDMESVLQLGSGEVESSEQDFEDLADLCLHMLLPTPAQVSSRGKKRNVIIQAAIQVFAEKGYNKAKISEIAKLAQVADGTVYDYFDSKEDLLLSIPEEHFSRYFQQASDAFEIKDPVRRLKRLIRFHYTSFLQERQFLKVFLLELQLTARFYGSKSFATFKRYFGLVEDVIVQGQEAGVFRPEADSRVFRNLFLGAFSHMALRWLIVRESSDADKMEEIDQATKLLVAAVLQPIKDSAGETPDSSGG
ncbi:MAG: TetR/AcrR family transcriptional regulator [Desulfarculaceae bacterium]|nr:TetR/AcrR family transcriptional regulator [Desulfarculaceae bacterium]